MTRTIFSGEYSFSLRNSEGKESKNGLGVLFVQDSTTSGPVVMDIKHAGKLYGCSFDYLCKMVGFEFTFEISPSAQPVVDAESYIFMFDKISCPVIKDGPEADDEATLTFELKKFKNRRTAWSPGNVLLVCGPIRLEGASCPVSVTGNFLKRVCMQDFGKKVFQCHSSKTLYAYATYKAGNSTYITARCENDPHFYQSCGMIRSSTPDSFTANNAAVCYDFVCSSTTLLVFNPRHPFRIASTNEVCDLKSEVSQTNCQTDGNECLQLELPKDICSAKNGTQAELPSGLMSPTSKICNGRCDVHYRCEDEAFCNGFLYGTYCTGYDGTLAYVRPHDVCNGKSHYLCLNVANDEQNCPDLATLSSHEKCHKSMGIFYSDTSFTLIPIVNRTRCAALWETFSVYADKLQLMSLCKNFIDQTNCSDSSRSSMVCTIGGYVSTVSKYFVCHGQSEIPSLCDNGIDQVCENRQILLTCKLHKHQLCDEIRDCYDGTDENLSICRSLTNRTCTRAFKHARALRIPLTWLRDGVEDCLNGVDEKDIWPSCGVGRTERFVDSGKTPCGEVFLCSHEQTAFVHLQDLCDGIAICGNEKTICDKSHLAIPTFDKAMGVERSDRIEKLIFYCLPGLESLQNLAHQCVHRDIQPVGAEVLGIKDLALILPDTKINCDHTFGEIYLLLSCSGLCSNSVCPIRNMIKHDSCPGQHLDRIYTIADNKFLSFVTKSRDGFNNDYFLCDNGFCIRYDQVCNLIDDCGDASDELHCTNVFICDSKNQLIPVFEKCDGKIDCSDCSDECNSQCGRDIIENVFLKVLCWCLGILATALNIASIVRIFSHFNMKMSVEALNNNVFILLVNVGDFLVGVYLLQVAVMDSIVYRDKYCDRQVEWLSSSHCNLLGILSTVGYQFSLGSVTALSLARVIGITKGMRVSEDISRNSFLSIAIKTSSILVISFAEALLPLMPQMEDFFVNGMTYDPLVKLFIGSPGKNTHMHIVQEYYGKVKEKNLKWRVINDLIDDMFSHDHIDNAIGRKNLNFMAMKEFASSNFL